MLSPMMPMISVIAGSRCGATRQICRSLKYSAILMALKCGLALFDKRFGRFLVVGGLAGARMMNRLGVETGFQRHGFGVVDVALDVAERHRRPVRERQRQFMRGLLDLGVGHDLGDDTEIAGFLRG